MLILLIGPKGGGKTHVGRLLERRYGVHFFHAERHWMVYHARCKDLGVTPNIAEGIQSVHPLLEDALRSYPRVSVETTGASREILDDLSTLRCPVPILRVRLVTPLQVCLQRVASRDASAQIPADRAMIERVHRLNEELDLPWDLVLENTDLSEQEIVEAFAPLLST